MAKREQQTFIKGMATHRRTESDYMGVLLDSVTLDDWRDVVMRTLEAAKEGNPAARAWLAQYLVGKPEGKAPTPLTVVVQQWSGSDPVADKLAKPFIDHAQYPELHLDDDMEQELRSIIGAELVQKLTVLKQMEVTETKKDSDDFAER